MHFLSFPEQHQPCRKIFTLWEIFLTGDDRVIPLKAKAFTSLSDGAQELEASGRMDGKAWSFIVDEWFTSSFFFVAGE